MKKFISLLLVLTAVLAITPKAEARPRVSVDLNIPIGGVGFGFCPPPIYYPPVYCAEPRRAYPQYVVERPIIFERPVIVERPYTVETPSVNRQILQVQAVLKSKGYYNKIVDGIYGQETQNAIRNYQLDRGLPATGRIDTTLVNDLGL
jgi:hypothetical protein